MLHSESTIGKFKVEDTFSITGRGWVLAGKLLTGQVSAGSYLVFEDSTRWKIRAVEFINYANSAEAFGLLIDFPIASHQELMLRKMIGAETLIFAQ
jgi:translation elongation factor EF-Tu-like GTPase